MSFRETPAQPLGAGSGSPCAVPHGDAPKPSSLGAVPSWSGSVAAGGSACPAGRGPRLQSCCVSGECNLLPRINALFFLGGCLQVAYSVPPLLVGSKLGLTSLRGRSVGFLFSLPLGAASVSPGCTELPSLPPPPRCHPSPSPSRSAEDTAGSGAPSSSAGHGPQRGHPKSP